MPTDPGLPRHARHLKWLKIGLVVGAIYDFVFAAMMLFAPWMATRLLELEPPEEPYFLWLIAVFLGMLGCFYLLAAYDPEAYRGNVDVAVLGRFAGFVALFAGAWGRPELWGLYPLAFADLFFSLFHAICWLPIRR